MYYRQQHAASFQFVGSSKDNLQLTLSTYRQLSNLPVVFMNPLQVSEVSEVRHINVIDTLVHKYGHVNQVQYVCHQRICSMLHMFIITIDMLYCSQLMCIQPLLESKSSMTPQCIFYIHQGSPGQLPNMSGIMIFLWSKEAANMTHRSI